MRSWWRLNAIGVLAAAMMLALGSNSGFAQSRAHVYLLRGLLNIFSLGMDTLADELNRRGVYATVDNHADWQSLADQAAANYKAGKEGPIILIGHSLGADAVMEMAAYLGTRGVPVALVVPFDGTQSFAASSNIGRVFNVTQRDYAYMARGAGFHGSLANIDVSGDPNISHTNIDKSPRLHARVISEVLAVVGSGHRIADAPGSPKPAAVIPAATGGAKTGTGGDDTVKPEGAPATPAKPGNGAMNAPEGMPPVADSGTPIIALPEKRGVSESTGAPVAPLRKPVETAQPLNPLQVPN
jgi:pimeloyl-ACP methyl ester carboxylesterase